MSAEEAAAPSSEEPSSSSPHVATLVFTFELADLPPPSPPPAVEGEAPPEPEEIPTLAGTHFVLRVPTGEPAPADDQPPPTTSFELAHPLSGDGAPESSSAELTVDEALVRWLAVERQGVVALALCRREAEGPRELCELPLDLAPLIFGRTTASARFEGTAATKETLPLPAAAAALTASLRVSVGCGELVSDELKKALNPLMVSAVRAEDLPPNYDGDPYKAPYQALREGCAPVYLRWRLWGRTGRTAERPHGKAAKFTDRQIFLCADVTDLRRRLREEPLVVEVHDRDPKAVGPPELVEAAEAARAEVAAAAAALAESEGGAAGEGERPSSKQGRSRRPRAPPPRPPRRRLRKRWRRRRVS